MGNWDKAKKHYNMIAAVFRNKDARNNFLKEDETLTTYRDNFERLEELQKTSLTNLAIVELKKKEYKQAIEYADECLKVDHKWLKALFLKGRALHEMTEFSQAIEHF